MARKPGHHRVGQREPWAQGWCWGLLVVLDGIRSRRRCPGQGGVQGPRWREFSLGARRVSVSSDSGAKKRPRDQTIYDGIGRSRWPQCSQGRRRGALPDLC